MREIATCCAAFVLTVGALDAEAAARAGAAPENAKATPRPGVLVAGPVRTDEEILLCRKEESARAHGEVGPEIQPPTEPVKLRSTPRKLSQKECDAQTRKWNFWSEENDARGCFVNMFSIHDEVLTQDVATGLSWDWGSDKTYSYPEVIALLGKTNARAWEGHSDWRLPTMEELSSIFESIKWPIRQRHLDERFFATGNSWWSADPAEKKGQHLGMSMDGTCDPFDDTRPRSVFFVRSMTREEWEEARREYKPPKRRQP